MDLITRQSEAQEYAARAAARHIKGGYAKFVAHQVREGDAAAFALGPNPTPEAVEALVYPCGYTFHPKCSVCFNKVDAVVRVFAGDGHEYATVCRACLVKALELIDSKDQ